MAAAYVFSDAAQRQQDNIWQYTYQHWGEAQADRYIHGLHDHLAALAEGSMPFRQLSHLYADLNEKTPDIFLSRYSKHFIYFRRLTDEKIGVIGILHGQMDQPARLSEILEATLIDRTDE